MSYTTLTAIVSESDLELEVATIAAFAFHDLADNRDAICADFQTFYL